MTQDEHLASEYARILRDYLQEQREASLNRLLSFARKLIEEDIGPERILAVHLEVVRDMMKELPAVLRPRLIALSFRCLSETLRGYELTVRERIKSKKLEYNHLKEDATLVEQKARELVSKVEALETIANLISKTADLYQNFNAILRKVLEALEIEAGEIYLWDEGKEELVYTTYHGLSDSFVQDSKSRRIGLGDDIPGRVVQLAEPIFSKDISKDSRFTRVIASEEGYRSFISVPLLFRHRVLGTLNLISRAEREFSPEVIRFLMLVGRQLGVAIEMCHLLEWEESRHKLVAPTEAVGAIPTEPTFVSGDLKINFAEKRVTVADHQVDLTGTEYRLLSYLARNAGIIVTPDQILEAVWGEEYLGEAHLLRINISRLRQKLGDDAKDPKYIHTRIGIGYMLLKSR